MTTLTKEQRNAIYIMALDLINNDKNYNHCCPAIKWSWSKVTGEKYPSPELAEVLILEFPEIMAFKPIKTQLMQPWFSDADNNKARKLALETCIKQTS